MHFKMEAIPHKKDRRRIVERITGLEDDPRPSGCEKLSGQDRYRLRQGHNRIVCSVEDQAKIVRVVKIGHRKDGWESTGL